MTLVAPTIEHFEIIASWLKTKVQLQQWAGPNMRFPMTVKSLMTDLNLQTLLSYSLLNESHELLAFGQCYERLRHCHLGRLIVAPEHRGKGVITDLIEPLSIVGCAEFETQLCSLFVLQDNVAAITAYQKNGFEMSTYPAVMTLVDCLYMTKKLGR